MSTADAPPTLPSGALRAEDHPSYPRVAALCAKYPAQGGALFQTFVDLQFSARWRELEAFEVPRGEPASGSGGASGSDLGAAGWAFVSGVPRDGGARVPVLPLDIDETLSAGVIRDIFAALPPDAPCVLLALMSGDGTVVYYRLAKGMVKPVN